MNDLIKEDKDGTGIALKNNLNVMDLKQESFFDKGGCADYLKDQIPEKVYDRRKWTAQEMDFMKYFLRK